jgi:WD40 repeat protein
VRKEDRVLVVRVVIVGAVLGAGGALPSPLAAQNRQPASATAADAEQARREYASWLARHARPLSAGLKLVVTAVEGEGAAPIAGEFGGGIVTYGCTLADDGALAHFHASEFGHQGSSGSSISADDLEQIDALLAKGLPGDRSRLPAAGRRVLVQAAGTKGVTIRVYDRANLPDEILELFRLGRAPLRAYVPEFSPHSEIVAREFEHGGLLALAPDGKRLLFSCTNGPLQIWEPTTHKRLGEISKRHDMPLDGITFSADGSRAVLSGGGDCEVVDTEKWERIRLFTEPYIERKRHLLSDPRFTPDGKQLVLQSSEPALRIFDTATWERVERLPNVPADTVRYLPAAKRRRAVIQTKGGAVALWALDRNARVVELDTDCSLTDAVFSPDETVVAVVTSAENHYRIRLWDAVMGQFLRELRPFEQRTCESVRAPFWSPDGRYLLAATKSDSLFTSVGISVWNSQTGRHRGEFAGCPTHVIGAALLADSGHLAVGCSDGRIRFYDFPAALKQIRAFEDSLTGD